MIKKLAKALVSEKTRLNLYFTFFKIRSIFYKGNNFYCVCCDKSFSKFLSHGNIPRANSVCPRCHSLERTRLLMYYLKNETDTFKKHLNILHFAPERAIENNIKSFNKSGYLTADINPAFADAVIDIQNIRLNDNEFDLVICSHVIGHVPDEAKAIDEIYRVLKVGGSALVLTLIDSTLFSTYENKNIATAEERLKHYGESDLLRLHGMDFISRLQRDKVTVERIDYSLHFNEIEKKKFQLGNKDREIIFKCKKLRS